MTTEPKQASASNGVSACDKSTDKQNKITITNDKVTHPFLTIDQFDVQT